MKGHWPTMMDLTKNNDFLQNRNFQKSMIEMLKIGFTWYLYIENWNYHKEWKRDRLIPILIPTSKTREKIVQKLPFWLKVAISSLRSNEVKKSLRAFSDPWLKWPLFLISNERENAVTSGFWVMLEHVEILVLHSYKCRFKMLTRIWRVF